MSNQFGIKGSNDIFSNGLLGSHKRFCRNDSRTACLSFPTKLHVPVVCPRNDRRDWSVPTLVVVVTNASAFMLSFFNASLDSGNSEIKV